MLKPTDTIAIAMYHGNPNFELSSDEVLVEDLIDNKALWNWLYRLMRQDKIQASTIQEGRHYTDQQYAWQDPQGLFFISFT